MAPSARREMTAFPLAHLIGPWLLPPPSVRPHSETTPFIRESAWAFYSLIRAKSNSKSSTRGSLMLPDQKRGRNVASAVMGTGPHSDNAPFIRTWHYNERCQNHEANGDDIAEL